MSKTEESGGMAAGLKVETARDYIKNTDDYLRSFKVQINGKIREIITYSSNEKGRALKQLHRAFAREASICYKSAVNSYAYKKGVGVINCLNQHMKSNSFLKTDIHEFFNTISFDPLYKLILEGNPRKRKKRLETLLKACFYDGHLPIGFITSPVLSDLFLHKVDETFLDRDGVIYTRYADDFIISGQDNISTLEQVKAELENILLEYGLELNHKKTYFRTLRQPGDAIHLLGVNLVNSDPKSNRITISDRYLRQTSKDICKYLKDCSKMNPEEEKKTRVSLYGKVGFVRYYSLSSYNKLEKMVSIKRGEIVNLSKVLRE